jgi:hypothetical protein
MFYNFKMHHMHKYFSHKDDESYQKKYPFILKVIET